MLRGSASARWRKLQLLKICINKKEKVVFVEYAPGRIKTRRCNHAREDSAEDWSMMWDHNGRCKIKMIER